MERTGRYRGTLNYISAHWPAYLFGYAGLVLLLLVVVFFSGYYGWWAYISLSFALILLVAYFFGVSIWAAHVQHDGSDFDLIFEMARLRPEDQFVHIGLGMRTTAVGLGRRLSTGHMTVIDVYNPQLMPNEAIVRARARAPQPGPDNRVTWREGSITLLPLPDSSVRTVTINCTLSALWQNGDHDRLLAEIWRILRPGGRLVMVEKVRSYTNWLVWGPLATRIPKNDYWRDRLTGAGFEIRQELAQFHGMVHFYRAEKPIPSIRGQQLKLGLEGIER